MAYDRIFYRLDYAQRLKEMVQEKENIYYIAKWANGVATSHHGYFAADFCKIFKTLRFMEEGFELTYEEIEEMADYLLLGCPLPKRPDTPPVNTATSAENSASKPLAVRKCLNIEDFTQELRERLYRQQGKITISKWVHAVYNQQPELFNEQAKELILTIIAIKDHPDFYVSDEEIDLIADRLSPERNTKEAPALLNTHPSEEHLIPPAFRRPFASHTYTDIGEFREEFRTRLFSNQEKVILGSWVEDVYKKQPELFNEDAIPLVKTLISLKDNPNPLLSGEEIAMIGNLLLGMDVPFVKIKYPNKKTE